MASPAAAAGLGGMHTQASPSLTSQVAQITGMAAGQGPPPPPPQQSQAASAQAQAPPGVAGGNQNGHAHPGPTVAPGSTHTVAVAVAAGPPPTAGAQGPPGNGPGGPILNVGRRIFFKSKIAPALLRVPRFSVGDYFF